MTTNQTIDGVLVSRELLESFAAYVADSPNAIMRSRAALLRALLDAPAKPSKFVGAAQYWSENEQALRDVCRFEGLKGLVYQVVRDCDKPAAQPQGEPVALAVWYGSMPESNGKSNWTAILYRKGDEGSLLGALSDGITIERSEYPDRVRYEADRVRYLIGELEKEPWILDYDADMHSGHVKPEQPAPVAVHEEFEFCKWTHEVIEESRIGGVTIKIQRMQHLTPGEEKSAHDAWMARAAMSNKSR